MKVPLLDLKQQYFLIREEINEAIKKVSESQHFILGPEVEKFEKEFANYCGTSYAVGCSSGSDALLLALMSLDIGQGDYVICPSFTFYSTASAITRLGARPIFVDICPKSFNISIDETRKILEKSSVANNCVYTNEDGNKGNIRAILPVHLFGQSVDMEAWSELGRKYNLSIIEDCAQSVGSKDINGNLVGTKSLFGCFSFFPSKNLGCFGDGGAVITNSLRMFNKLKRLRVHGMEPKYEHQEIGINGRLDAIQAAILRVKLRYLDKWHNSRLENAKAYNCKFLSAGGIELKNYTQDYDLPLIVPSIGQGNSKHVFNQYVIRVPKQLRDLLRTHLNKNEIGCEIYYKTPLHLQPCFSYLNVDLNSCGTSQKISNEVLALPVYPELDSDQQTYVVDIVVSFLKRYKKQYKFCEAFEPIN